MAKQKTWNLSALSRGQDEKWIRRAYNNAIKSANDRIKTLSKPEYAGRSQAYEFYVKSDLQGAPYTKERGGNIVFKAIPRSADREQALEALRMVERFLQAKTSTAAGIKAVENQRRDELNKMLQEDHANHGSGGSAPELSKSEADAILRWMGSEEGRAAKASYDSNQTREAITKAYISTRGLADRPSVSELYQNFMESQQTLADWITQSEEDLGYYDF